MDFFTSCYWQQGRNVSALLLQQYVCQGRSVYFACVCDGKEEDPRAGGYMTEQLLRWFRSLRLRRLAKKTEKGLEEAAAGLERTVLQADEELAEAGITESGQSVSLGGIFCVEEQFFLYYRGERKIYFINTGFGRTQGKWLMGKSEDLRMERGVLQPDVGLLFATDSFWKCIAEQTVKEGLFVREVAEEEQMQRHLNELGEEAVRLGGRNVAAVFVRTNRGAGG